MDGQTDRQTDGQEMPSKRQGNKEHTKSDLIMDTDSLACYATVGSAESDKDAKLEREEASSKVPAGRIFFQGSNDNNCFLCSYSCNSVWIEFRIDRIDRRNNVIATLTFFFRSHPFPIYSLEDC